MDKHETKRAATIQVRLYLAAILRREGDALLSYCDPGGQDRRNKKRDFRQQRFYCDTATVIELDVAIPPNDICNGTSSFGTISGTTTFSW